MPLCWEPSTSAVLCRLPSPPCRAVPSPPVLCWAVPCCGAVPCCPLLSPPLIPPSPPVTPAPLLLYSQTMGSIPERLYPGIHSRGRFPGRSTLARHPSRPQGCAPRRSTPREGNRRGFTMQRTVLSLRKRRHWCSARRHTNLTVQSALNMATMCRQDPQCSHEDQPP